MTQPHAVIDNKHWQIFGNKDGRDYAARRSVRGARQRKGQKPEGHVIKPKKPIKYPAKSVAMTVAVIRGRIRMWEYVPQGQNWNGETAAAMYRGPLIKALARAYPERAKTSQEWQVLEDNDPAGYKSGKAMQAKRDVGIITDDLPRRSPDLNVLDYSLWHAINLQMRAQERALSPRKAETEAEYLSRLRKTAWVMPAAQVEKAVASMHKRARMMFKENGNLFVE